MVRFKLIRIPEPLREAADVWRVGYGELVVGRHCGRRVVEVGEKMGAELFIRLKSYFIVRISALKSPRAGAPSAVESRPTRSR